MKRARRHEGGMPGGRGRLKFARNEDSAPMPKGTGHGRQSKKQLRDGVPPWISKKSKGTDERTNGRLREGKGAEQQLLTQEDIKKEDEKLRFFTFHGDGLSLTAVNKSYVLSGSGGTYAWPGRK